MEIDGVDLTLDNLRDGLLELVVGEKWPDGDKDAMRRAADAWKQAAAELDAIAEDANRAARGVGQYLRGQNGDAFGDFWSRTFDNGKPTSALPYSVKFCGAMAQALDGGATQIEMTQDTILGNIALLVVTVTPQIAAAVADFGTTLATAAGEILAERFAVEGLLRTAAEFMVRIVADCLLQGLEQGAGQAAISFSVQFAEVEEGNLKGISYKDVEKAGLAGFEGGVIGGAVGLGVGAAGGAIFGKAAAESLGGKAATAIVTGGLASGVQQGHLDAADFAKGSLAGVAGSAIGEAHETAGTADEHAAAPDLSGEMTQAQKLNLLLNGAPAGLGDTAAPASSGTRADPSPGTASSGAVPSAGRAPETAPAVGTGAPASDAAVLRPVHLADHGGALESSTPAPSPAAASVGPADPGAAPPPHDARPGQPGPVNGLAGGDSPHATAPAPAFTPAAPTGAPDHAATAAAPDEPAPPVGQAAPAAPGGASASLAPPRNPAGGDAAATPAPGAAVPSADADTGHGLAEVPAPSFTPAPHAGDGPTAPAADALAGHGPDAGYGGAPDLASASAPTAGTGRDASPAEPAEPAEPAAPPAPAFTPAAPAVPSFTPTARLDESRAPSAAPGPSVPETTRFPADPVIPRTPRVPGIPHTPEVPRAAGAPRTPEVPRTPEAPVTPAARPEDAGLAGVTGPGGPGLDAGLARPADSGHAGAGAGAPASPARDFSPAADAVRPDLTGLGYDGGPAGDLGRAGVPGPDTARAGRPESEARSDEPGPADSGGGATPGHWTPPRADPSRAAEARDGTVADTADASVNPAAGHADETGSRPDDPVPESGPGDPGRVRWEAPVSGPRRPAGARDDGPAAAGDGGSRPDGEAVTPGAEHPGPATAEHTGPVHGGQDDHAADAPGPGRNERAPEAASSIRPLDDSRADGLTPRQRQIDMLLNHGPGAADHDPGAYGRILGPKGRGIPRDSGLLPEHLSRVGEYGDVKENSFSAFPDRETQQMQDMVNQREDLARDGSFSLNLHGDEKSAAWGGQRLTARDLLDLANAAGHEDGQPIRLTSCDAGRETDGLASELARISGCKVIATDTKVWTDDLGHMFASDSHRDYDGTEAPDIPPNGHWHEFSPDGTSTRLDTPVEGFPPGDETGFGHWTSPVGRPISRDAHDPADRDAEKNHPREDSGDSPDPAEPRPAPEGHGGPSAGDDDPRETAAGDRDGVLDDSAERPTGQRDAGTPADDRNREPVGDRAGDDGTGADRDRRPDDGPAEPVRLTSRGGLDPAGVADSGRAVGTHGTDTARNAVSGEAVRRTIPTEPASGTTPDPRAAAEANPPDSRPETPSAEVSASHSGLADAGDPPASSGHDAADHGQNPAHSDGMNGTGSPADSDVRLDQAAMRHEEPQTGHAPDARNDSPESAMGWPNRDKTGHADRPNLPWAANERSPKMSFKPLLARPDGSVEPPFDGPITREQTRQGALGDCFMIATFGAVAGHRPDDIRAAVRETSDGTYEVRLHQARYSATTKTWKPTGKMTTLTVSADLPVSSDDPDHAAYADTGSSQGGSVWNAVLEKAFAGIDQTWDKGRKSDWERRWYNEPKSVKNGQKMPAEGYGRLHIGGHEIDQAEILTQLTGQSASVRELPESYYDRTGKKISSGTALADEFRAFLQDGKPVMVGTRRLNLGENRLPFKLFGSHAYEVVKVDSDGKIYLRNPYNRKNPEPITPGQFVENFRKYYTTLGGN